MSLNSSATRVTISEFSECFKISDTGGILRCYTGVEWYVGYPGGKLCPRNMSCVRKATPNTSVQRNVVQMCGETKCAKVVFYSVGVSAGVFHSNHHGETPRISKSTDSFFLTL